MRSNAMKTNKFWMRELLALVICTIAAGCGPDTAKAQSVAPGPKTGEEVATFAGGCFWCMVAPFEQLPGVRSVISGYTGGHVTNPSYQEVSSGKTGHAESVQVIYDPKQVSYSQLLQVFWHNIDPLAAKRQFCDSGDQYRTAIFYHGEDQKKAAEASRDALASSGALNGPVVTEIVPASTFYAAEDAHQDFFKTHDIQYQIYRHGCGRDERLKQLYGAGAGH